MSSPRFTTDSSPECKWQLTKQSLVSANLNETFVAPLFPTISPKPVATELLSTCVISSESLMWAKTTRWVAWRDTELTRIKLGPKLSWIISTSISFEGFSIEPTIELSDSYVPIAYISWWISWGCNKSFMSCFDGFRPAKFQVTVKRRIWEVSNGFGGSWRETLFTAHLKIGGLVIRFRALKFSFTF